MRHSRFMPSTAALTPVRARWHRAAVSGVAAVVVMFAVVVGVVPFLGYGPTASAEPPLLAYSIDTDMKLAASPEVVYSDDPITAVATITPADAQGVVKFTLGATTLTVPVSSGTATVVFPAGTDPGLSWPCYYCLWAEFVPTDPRQFGESEDYVSLDVLDPGMTDLELTVSPSPVAYRPTTLTARIKPATTQGTVIFALDQNSDDDELLYVPIVNGVATVERVFTRVGEHDFYSEFTDLESGYTSDDYVTFVVSAPGGLSNPGGGAGGSSLGLQTLQLGNLVGSAGSLDH